MSMGAAAFAADEETTTTGTNKITVTGTVKDETYKVYKMFDLVVDDPANPTAFKYTVATGWTDFFTTGYGKDYVTIDATDGHIEWKEGMDADAKMILLAQEAEKVASNPAATKVADGTTVEFTGLENGYYLITSTLGTKAMIDSTPTNPAQTIAEKNPEDTIEKTVKEDSTGVYGESNDAQVGQLVEFKSVATIEPYTRNVKIHDTMSTGLDFTSGSIKIYTDEALETELAATNYEVLATADDGDTFTIEIKDTYIATLSSSTKLYITYTATLNEKAVVNDGTTGIVDQKNTTKITYGDKQSVTDDTTTTTHKFEIKKHNSSNDLLAGAKFKLYIMTSPAVEANESTGTEAAEAVYAEVPVVKIDDTNYRVAKAGETGVEIVTVSTANIVVWGVDSDDYYLEETEAPAGYNKLADKQKVTVNAAADTVADVLNNSGTELPSTGGIGTTIFYVVGSIMVVAAGVLLITKKRMSREG